MKTIPPRHHAAGKRKIRRRLDRPVTTPSPEPILTATTIPYEAATKTQARSRRGLAAIPRLVRKLGLAEAIDERLPLLKFHFPDHESDHVLNFASNALGNGTCLDDLKRRRNDVLFLDARGADRIPDPTTAGDFGRRFTPDDVETLQDVFEPTRVKLWRGDSNRPSSSMRPCATWTARSCPPPPAASRASTSPTRAPGATTR